MQERRKGQKEKTDRRKKRKERNKEARDGEKDGKKRKRQRLRKKDYKPMYKSKIISTNTNCKVGRLFASLLILHVHQTSVLQILRFHSHKKDTYCDLNS
jgi:hypothetical protein